MRVCTLAFDSWLLAGLAVACSCCLELPACHDSWNCGADQPALSGVLSQQWNGSRHSAYQLQYSSPTVSRWKVLEKSSMVLPSYWLPGNSIFINLTEIKCLCWKYLFLRIPSVSLAFVFLPLMQWNSLGNCKSWSGKKEKSWKWREWSWNWRKICFLHWQ